MPRSIRRVLVHPDAMRQMVNRMRDEFDARMRDELSRMRDELDAIAAHFAARDAAREAELAEVRAQLDALKAAVRARQKAERDLAELHRRRDSIIEGFAAERDGRPLH